MESNGKKFSEFEALDTNGRLRFLYIEQVRANNILEKLESKIGFTTALYGFLGGAIPVLILVAIKYVFG